MENISYTNCLASTHPPNKNNSCTHSMPMFWSRHATPSLLRWKEGVAWRGWTMAAKETTVCVKPVQLRDNKPMQLRDNKPMCAFISDKLEVFFFLYLSPLTLSTLTSVSIFSIIFSIRFLWYWQGEVFEQSRASLVGKHFLYSRGLNVWFRDLL